MTKTDCSSSGRVFCRRRTGLLRCRMQAVYQCKGWAKFIFLFDVSSAQWGRKEHRRQKEKAWRVTRKKNFFWKGENNKGASKNVKFWQHWYLNFCICAFHNSLCIPSFISHDCIYLTVWASMRPSSSRNRGKHPLKLWWNPWIRQDVSHRFLSPSRHLNKCLPWKPSPKKISWQPSLKYVLLQCLLFRESYGKLKWFPYCLR